MSWYGSMYQNKQSSAGLLVPYGRYHERRGPVDRAGMVVGNARVDGLIQPEA